MNQFIYFAHAGHIHPEKVDAVVIIPPVALAVAAIVLLAVVVGGALISTRMATAKASDKPNKHQ